MKLRQVEFAVAVARTGSFSAAAAHCHVTQPTLSTGLAQLEDGLGAKLFARTTRQVTLTPFGRHMLPHLVNTLTARDEAKAAAAAFLTPVRKLLRIGISPLVDMTLVDLVTQPYRAAHGEVEVFFKECLLDDLADRLSGDALDVLILPDEVVPEALDRMPFYTDPMVYVPMGGPAANAGAPVTFATLPDDPIILTGGGCGLNHVLKTAFARAGVAPTYYPGHAVSYPVIEEWAQIGLGASILPRAKVAATRGAAPVLRTDGSAALFGFSWAWPREARVLAHVSAFLDAVAGRGAPLAAGRVAPRSIG